MKDTPGSSRLTPEGTREMQERYGHKYVAVEDNLEVDHRGNPWNRDLKRAWKRLERSRAKAKAQ